MKEPENITSIFWAAMMYVERKSGAAPTKWGFGEPLAGVTEYNPARLSGDGYAPSTTEAKRFPHGVLSIFVNGVITPWYDWSDNGDFSSRANTITNYRLSDTVERRWTDFYRQTSNREDG